jgi:hypothetical protein
MLEFIAGIVLLGAVVFVGLALFSVCLAYFIDASQDKDHWEE